MSLDESMHMSGTAPVSRWSRQYRSGSSDSQTPLTAASHPFGYPPSHGCSDSPPPMPQRRAFRWWWLFGSRPREVKPEEPSLRWRVDGPDGSSTGHGHSNNGHEDYHARYTGVLQTTPEDVEEADGDIIRIGENFTSIPSTPLMQPFPDQAKPVRGTSTVPDHPGSSVARTPVPPAKSNSGTPVSLPLREVWTNLSDGYASSTGVLGEPRLTTKLRCLAKPYTGTVPVCRGDRPHGALRVVHPSGYPTPIAHGDVLIIAAWVPRS